MRWRFVWDLRHPDLRTYFWRSLPIMLGFSIVVVDDWLLRKFGSLLGAGAISSLQYAKTLMKVPMGVFGLATGVAAFPTLTRLIASGDKSQAYGTLTLAVRRMLVLAFMSQVMLSVAGSEISQVIYGRRNIPVSQHAMIGLCMAIMALSLWAWAAQTVVARGFYALGNTWLPTVLGTIIVVLTYPLYAVLEQHYGILGLAYASSMAVMIYVVLLMAILHKSFSNISSGYVGFFARVVPATAFSIAVGSYIHAFITIASPFWRGLVVAVLSSVLYGFLLFVLKVSEARDIVAFLGRRYSPKTLPT
jgi:putative peptidoglycan lipid II flippase